MILSNQAIKADRVLPAASRPSIHGAECPCFKKVFGKKGHNQRLLSRSFWAKKV